MPMQKITSSLKRKEKDVALNRSESRDKMEPTDASLDKIMQFASSYRVEKLKDNEFVELILN